MSRNKSELMRECERVNALLLGEAKKLELGTKKSLVRMNEARECDMKTFYFWAKLEFQEYCRRQLERNPTIHASLLINEGAQKLGVSTATTKRYMVSLRAGRTSPFSSMGDIVMLNPNYVPSEMDPYWQECEVEEEAE
jgi:hypothetical protein